MATRFRAAEHRSQPKPKRDRIVLMADEFGRVHYEDDAGRVALNEVINLHCRRREREAPRGFKRVRSVYETER